MKQSISKHLLRILLVLASTAIIVAFYPRERNFSFDYTVGKPWKYGQIIAAYDFPIYKSEDVIRQELDSAFKSFQPYYQYDTSVGNVQIQAFAKATAEMDKETLPAGYRRYIMGQLKDIYQAGIMDSHDYQLNLDSAYTIVRVAQGNTATSRSLKAIYTTRSAYERILATADSSHLNREVLNRCDINDYLTTNLTYDEPRSQDQRQDIQNSVSYASGMVQAGQKIVDRGDIVTPHIASIIESMEKESIKRHEKSTSNWWQMGGETALVLIIFVLYTIFLGTFHRAYLEQWRSLGLLFSLLVIFTVAVSLLSQQTPQSVYIVPLTMIAVFVSVFMDSRVAFITNLTAIILSSVPLHDSYMFVVTNTISAVVAIFSLKQLTSRSQIIRTAFIVTAVTLAFMFAFELCMGYSVKQMDTTWYTSEGLNGVLLLFTYPFIFVFEKLFGFTSAVTLLELSNVNHPLLRRLSKEAQGTFNHSMQVATLASEAASKIDADVLLVRTGALYHDIGKIMNAAYFTENQSGTNPHDSLSEERSAQIIIQHVADGLALAEKYGLPKVLRDFISTHHGRCKATYFYIKYRNNHPNEPVDEALFTYPGPNPFTKEQAILMMADSVEAASKSLKTINEETLTTLVNNIIDNKVKEGCFKNCPITFRDIQTTKDVFVASLKMIYHTRISYPTLNTPTPTRGRTGSIFGRRRSFYKMKGTGEEQDISDLKSR